MGLVGVRVAGPLAISVRVDTVPMTFKRAQSGFTCLESAARFGRTTAFEHASITVLTRYTLLVDTLAGTDDLRVAYRTGDDGCGAAATLVSITVFVKLTDGLATSAQDERTNIVRFSSF